MTAGLMPARLRDAFELPFGPIERAVFATSAPARVHDRASPLLRRHWMGDHLASHPRSATIAR
jgi:hypothetical protein